MAFPLVGVSTDFIGYSPLWSLWPWLLLTFSYLIGLAFRHRWLPYISLWWWTDGLVSRNYSNHLTLKITLPANPIRTTVRITLIDSVFIGIYLSKNWDRRCLSVSGIVSWEKNWYRLSYLFISWYRVGRQEGGRSENEPADFWQWLLRQLLLLHDNDEGAVVVRSQAAPVAQLCDCETGWFSSRVKEQILYPISHQRAAWSLLPSPCHLLLQGQASKPSTYLHTS